MYKFNCCIEISCWLSNHTDLFISIENRKYSIITISSSLQRSWHCYTCWWCQFIGSQKKKINWYCQQHYNANHCIPEAYMLVPLTIIVFQSNSQLHGSCGHSLKTDVITMKFCTNQTAVLVSYVPNFTVIRLMWVKILINVSILNLKFDQNFINGGLLLNNGMSNGASHTNQFHNSLDCQLTIQCGN